MGTVPIGVKHLRAIINGKGDIDSDDDDDDNDDDDDDDEVEHFIQAECLTEKILIQRFKY